MLKTSLKTLKEILKPYSNTKMKKLIVLSLVLFTFALSGCEKLEDAREQAHNTLDSAKSSLNETKNTLETAVNKIDETVKDTKEAGKQIQEAKDAIDAITE